MAHDFLAKLESADALVISFAEHNGSYSAAYKNLPAFGLGALGKGRSHVQRVYLPIRGYMKTGDHVVHRNPRPRSRSSDRGHEKKGLQQNGRHIRGGSI